MGRNDPARRAAVAEHFDAIVLEQLRRRGTTASRSRADVTTELLKAIVEDPKAPGGRRALSEAEVLSILRNWTAGDLGTIAACVGIVAHRLISDLGLQSSLRQHVDDAVVLDGAIDECLRIDDPFLWNRRVATRDVEVAGCVIPAGAKVILHWTAANRDPRRFDDPDAFRPKENALHNLVYGVGAHVCPGRQLATLQLRSTFASLLRGAGSLEPAERLPLRASGDAGGFEHVWIVLS
jgi:cytochrome P450